MMDRTYRFDDCRYVWSPLQAAIFVYHPRRRHPFEQLEAPFPPDNAEMSKWVSLHEDEVARKIERHHKKLRRQGHPALA